MGQAFQDQLVPLMSEAAFKGDIAMMERLLSKGASVNQHDQYDRTPLHFAAFNGHLEAVRWLIDQKADVNVSGVVNGFTPLFAACENNDLEVAKLLVEAGADTSTKSRDGRTPIQHALHHNRTYVADYLHQVITGNAPSRKLALFERETPQKNITSSRWGMIRLRRLGLVASNTGHFMCWSVRAARFPLACYAQSLDRCASSLTSRGKQPLSVAPS